MTYDAWQVSFALSTMSNLANGVVITEQLDKSKPFLQAVADAQAAAQAALTGQLVASVKLRFATPSVQAEIGADWTPIWGPSVDVVAPRSVDWDSGIATFVAANSAFLAHSASQQRYVLAIAGTNAVSWFEWLAEDLFLSPGVTWSSALQAWAQTGSPVIPTSGSIPNLTSGTFLGVLLVLGLQDPVSQTPLRTVLRNLTIQATDTVTVTGHSLGGALSPTLALALIDPLGPLSSLPKSQVRAYPTAGPTPGNQAFAERYLAVLPPTAGTQPWQIWNGNVWNVYDVVPRAWTVDTMCQIPAFYALSGEYDARTIALISVLIAAATDHSNGFATTAGAPGRLDTAAISGMFGASVLPKNAFAYEYDPPGQPAQYLTIPQATHLGIPESQLKPIALLDQISYQHIDAYAQLILPGATPALQAPLPRMADMVRRMAAVAS